MSADDLHGDPSPRVRAAADRLEWEKEYSRTCRCDWHEGVRFESTGMHCGKCDRVIVLRRTVP